MKMRFLSIVVLLAGLAFASESPTPKTIRSIDDVLRNASRREKVLISGTVKRAFDLDTVVVAENNAEIAVSFVGVRQDIRPGDRIVVAGRFDGRLSYRSSYGLLNAIDWAEQSDAKVNVLLEQFGTTATPAPSPAPQATVAAPSSPASIELRLQQLEMLKTKNLVTPEEYQEHRKRILGDL